MFLLFSFLVFYIRVASSSEAVTYHMTEELPVGTIIGNLSADAQISSQYPDLRYSFITSSTTAIARQLFAIGGTSGTLSIRRRVDRDALCPSSSESCSLTLDVAIAPARYFRVISVTIEIDDVNDNTPRFRDEKLTLKVAESTTVSSRFALPTAEDVDGKRFGLQRYVLLGADELPFALATKSAIEDDSQTLDLVVTQPLDREVRDFYSLRVMALDGGVPPKSAQLSVSLTVVDVNDNKPVFEHSEYTAQLAEDSRAGTLILTVVATDNDQGDFGRIVYGFTDTSAHKHAALFDIDAVSGALRLRSAQLDYERETRYTLAVTARDGSEKSATTARVTIEITDVNDNSPHIDISTLTESEHVASISESAPVGTFVAYLSTHDNDAGMNSQVSCSITNGNVGQSFTLQEVKVDQFKLISSVELDRENISKYSLTIMCFDNGKPRKSNEKRLHVIVEDINDNRPRFQQSSYTARVQENNKPGVVLVNVSADDADEGDNGVLVYRIADTDSWLTNWIRVDAESGAVSAWQPLDRETLPVLKFRIEVRDRGTPSSLSSVVPVTIIVLDVNDETPTFSNTSHTFIVRENSAIGTYVGKVTATDADSEPEYQLLRYSLRSHTDVFKINEITGDINTRVVLDRETHNAYQLSVAATNVGSPYFSSITTVAVEVSDENDNAPRIYYPDSDNDNNTVHISNKLAIGQRISRVIAYDIDLDENSQMYFSFTKQAVTKDIDSFFSINVTSGVIVIAGDLSGVAYRVFSVDVAVHDRGHPPRVATSALHIVVNESISLPASSMTSSSTSNVTAVVCVVTLTGVAAGFLLAFIIRTVRKNKMDEDRENNSQQRAIIGDTSKTYDHQSTGVVKVDVHRRNSLDNCMMMDMDCLGHVYGSHTSNVLFDQQHLMLQQISQSGDRSEVTWDHVRDTSRMSSVDSGCGVSDEGTTSTEPEHIVSAGQCNALHVTTNYPLNTIYEQRQTNCYRVTNEPPCRGHVNESSDGMVVCAEDEMNYSRRGNVPHVMGHRKQVTFDDESTSTPVHKYSRETFHGQSHQLSTYT